MHGLIFVTWEKFLLEQYGLPVLTTYRGAIAGSEASVPLASRVYDDDILLSGLNVVNQATGKAHSMLLREFGRYFILNSLTSRMCGYLLTRATNARDLMLLMRGAHAQMRSSNADDAAIFTFEANAESANVLFLSYNSHRQLCPLLLGAIEGAAVRYNERVEIIERACMREGGRACLFDIRFSSSRQVARPANKLLEHRHQEQQQLANMVLQLLPYEDGVTLPELQKRLQTLSHLRQNVRPSVLLGAVNHLRLAGLINSTANEPGDDFTTRRYWRVRLASYS